MSNIQAENIIQKLDRPIVFIGMMGSGKSHAGSVLAKALRLPFVDSDQEIEKRAGCSVAEVFERDGEERFRIAEKNVILELLSGKKAVISTGGGAIIQKEVAEAIWNKSLSIWIKADLPTLIQRLADKKDRPLLAGVNLEEKLTSLLAERQSIYEKADISIDTSQLQVENTLQDVLQALDQFLSEKP